MENEFVTYQQALALKELGFDEPCFGYYVDGGLRGVNLGIEELGGVKPYYERFGFHTINNHHIDNKNKIVVSSPLYQQAFRWFRENYSLQHHIWIGEITTLFYGYNILDTKTHVFLFIVNNIELGGGDCDYPTYEEAESACIDKLIEIVKKQ